MDTAYRHTSMLDLQCSSDIGSVRDVKICEVFHFDLMWCDGNDTTLENLGWRAATWAHRQRACLQGIQLVDVYAPVTSFQMV